MDDLQVKVLQEKVYISYISLFDAEESFYGEFNLKEYRQKLKEFDKDHKFEISGDYGKLKFTYNNQNIHIDFFEDGKTMYLLEKNLSDKFFI